MRTCNNNFYVYKIDYPLAEEFLAAPIAAVYFPA